MDSVLLALAASSTQLRHLRQLRCVLSTSECFDQKHTGIHAPPQYVDLVPFVLQGDGLRRRNADIGRVPFPTQLQAFCRSATEMEIVQQF